MTTALPARLLANSLLFPSRRQGRRRQRPHSATAAPMRGGLSAGGYTNAVPEKRMPCWGMGSRKAACGSTAGGLASMGPRQG